MLPTRTGGDDVADLDLVIGDHHQLDAVGPGEGTAHEVRSMRLELGGDQSGTAARRERRQQSSLASRPGAQVEPPQIRPVHGCVGERDRHQLGSLVLHSSPALRDRRDRTRVAAESRADCLRASASASSSVTSDPSTRTEAVLFAVRHVTT